MGEGVGVGVGWPGTPRLWKRGSNGVRESEEATAAGAAGGSVRVVWKASLVAMEV
jgi:hypothetical protein